MGALANATKTAQMFKKLTLTQVSVMRGNFIYGVIENKLSRPILISGDEHWDLNKKDTGDRADW